MAQIRITHEQVKARRRARWRQEVVARLRLVGALGAPGAALALPVGLILRWLCPDNSDQGSPRMAVLAAAGVLAGFTWVAQWWNASTLARRPPEQVTFGIWIIAIVLGFLPASLGGGLAGDRLIPCFQAAEGGTGEWLATLLVALPLVAAVIAWRGSRPFRTTLSVGETREALEVAADVCPAPAAPGGRVVFRTSKRVCVICTQPLESGQPQAQCRNSPPHVVHAACVQTAQNRCPWCKKEIA